MSRLAFFSTLGILTLAACSSGGSSNGTTTGASGNTITISANFAFSPDPLVVAAGSTVTVNNTDTLDVHTATSEAAASDYTKGQADGGFTFDTGNIPAGGSATITIPAGLPSGTIQPYFCEQHMGMMKNPNPTIRIQ